MRNLELQHISKRFDEGYTDTVLHDVNLVVENGEFLAIMGASGCGKSTLMRIIAGLIQPSAGLVLNRPSKIGFVFQSFGLMPWLTVEENIAFGLKMSGSSSHAIRRVVSEQVKAMGLDGLEHNYPSELSGGQKQRVGIARALAIDPDILLLDECFSALDPLTAGELRADVLNIWQSSGKTVIMVTHLPEEDALMADRIAVMTSHPGTIHRVLNNPLTRPRDERSSEFYALVDKLKSYITGH